MKKVLVVSALLLLLVAWYMNGNLASNPAFDSGAASQPSSADYALQQAQQQVAATAQVMAAAYTQPALTADAQAMLAAQQQAQATATAQAQFAQQAAQVIEAKATTDARAVLLVQQQAQTAATEQAMIVQQAAQVIEAKATVDARAVLLVQQQAQATATAEAMQRESVTAVQAADASRQQSETLSWLIPIGVVIVFGVVVVLGVKYIGGLIDRTNERRSLKNRRLDLTTTLFETHNETRAFVDEAAPLPQLLMPTDEIYDPGEAGTSLSSSIDAAAPPAMAILPNGDPLLPDQAETREEVARCKLAMKLLRAAIGHTQTHSNRIPSAVQLGWAANAWAVAVAILRPYGVETLPGSEGGTYLVGQYPTLQALYIAMGERRSSLHPPHN